MIQMRSILDVADNSGARKISVINPIGGAAGRYAYLGDIITANVKESAPDAPEGAKKGKVGVWDKIAELDPNDEDLAARRASATPSAPARSG